MLQDEIIKLAADIELSDRAVALGMQMLAGAGETLETLSAAITQATTTLADQAQRLEAAQATVALQRAALADEEARVGTEPDEAQRCGAAFPVPLGVTPVTCQRTVGHPLTPYDRHKYVGLQPHHHAIVWNEA